MFSLLDERIKIIVFSVVGLIYFRIMVFIVVLDDYDNNELNVECVCVKFWNADECGIMMSFAMLVMFFDEKFYGNMELP